ncbi:MAG: hypothetical protein HS132_08000 [Planctomycetia bacterium]|nr:hypothetical protein [Planctomycetia bacterium]
MNVSKYISYYHSLPWPSSQLSKIITGYADKLNNYLLSNRTFNNSSVPVNLVFFMFDSEKRKFHFLSSLHTNILINFTIPFLEDRNFFLRSLNPILDRIPQTKEVNESYEFLRREQSLTPATVANFLNVSFYFPLPVEFIDGFLFELWSNNNVNADESFEVLISSKPDPSGLPRFAIKQLHSKDWIKNNNDSIWHGQAKREDIQPVTFYKDWIGAITGVTKAIHSGSKHGFWIPVVNECETKRLLGFLHARAKDREILQVYELFWKNNLHGFVGEIKNVGIKP